MSFKNSIVALSALAAAAAFTGVAADDDIDRDILYLAPSSTQVEYEEGRDCLETGPASTDVAEYDIDRDILYLAPVSAEAEYDIDRDILYTAPEA